MAWGKRLGAWALAAVVLLPAAGPVRAETAVFTETERRILQGLLDQWGREPGAQRGGPPGRGGGLPPGIARNLERGKPLPPGLAGRQLPPEASRQLPHRDRYEVVMIGDDAYLIGRATGVIVDILRGN